MEFNNAPPEWENKGAEPGEDLKKQGFLAGYKPPAAYFNWFWNKTSACIKELQEKLKGITKSDVGLDKVDNKSLEEILTEVTMDKANAKDTSGLVGAAQENVKAQQLLDELANRVATKLVEKGMIANNLVTDNTEMVLAAPMGKALQEQITEQNNNKLDKTEFDNLTIGGRNLYTGTKDFSGTWTNGSYWTTDGTYNGFTVKTRTDSWFVLCQERNVYAGEVYTCSLYIKIGTLNNFSFAPNLGGTGLKYKYLNVNQSIDKVNTWTRIHRTIEVTEDGTMRFGVEPNATGGGVWICGMMLENGTKPTDWTPAPEDLENPVFDDSGTTEGINSFTDFMNSVKSKMNIFQFFKNFKAGMKYVLHTGRLVNNAVTTEEGFALDARMGKTLQDQITDVNKNLNTGLTELKKSVADGKNLIGNVVGGNSSSTFQVLANNAQSIKNSRDSLNSQLSAMTADRDNWMNIANNRLSFKTLTLPISKSGYGASVSGSIAHGCGVTPKYVFGLLSWYGDQDTYLNNFFIANISGITFYIPLAYYTRNFLTLSVDSTTISLSGSSNDTVWSGLPSSMTCYVFY